MITALATSRLVRAWWRSDFGKLARHIGPGCSWADVKADLDGKIAERACKLAGRPATGLTFSVAATAAYALCDITAFDQPEMAMLDDHEQERLLALYKLPAPLRIWSEQHASVIAALLQSLPRWLDRLERPKAPGMQVELLDLPTDKKKALDSLQRAILDVSESGRICLGPINQTVAAMLAQVSERVRQKPGDGFDSTGGPLYLRHHSQKDERKLLDGYFKGTPIPSLMRARVPFETDAKTRSRHTLFIAAPGSGKSWATMRRIVNLLPLVLAGLANLIIIDPKCELVDTLLRLAAFAPGAPLLDRTWLIDPSVDALTPRACLWGAHGKPYPYDLAKSTLHYMIGKVDGRPMSDRQVSVFAHYLRAMQVMGDANLDKLAAALRDPTLIDPIRHRLPQRSRDYFNNDADELGAEVAPAIGWRINQLQDHRRLNALINHSMTDADFVVGDLTKKGVVMLVRLPEFGLGAEQQSVIGRTLLALAGLDVAERYDRSESGADALPTSLIIDEAHRIFPGADEYVLHFLRTARGAGYGVEVISQMLANFDPAMRGALLGMTATRIIGRVGFEEAEKLGKELKCSPDLFPPTDADTEKRSFVLQVDGWLNEGSMAFQADDRFGDVGWQADTKATLDELRTRFTRPASPRPETGPSPLKVVGGTDAGSGGFELLDE